MKSQDETLEDWCRALLQALELEDVEVDVNEILSQAAVLAFPELQENGHFIGDQRYQQLLRSSGT